MDTKTKLALNLLLSLSVLLLIFHLIGIDALLSSLSQVDLRLFALALALYLLINLMMSLRIRMVLEGLGERLPLLGILPSNMAGMLASDFTPARSGYFFTAFSLSSHFRIPLEKPMLSIFGPQLFDFLIKISSATLLMAILLSTLGSDGLLLNALVILVALGAVIGSGLLIFHPPFLALLSPLERLPLASKGFGFLRSMHEHSHKLLAMRWQIIGITFITWTLKGLEYYVLSLALGIHLSDSFLYGLGLMMVLQAAITILQFLPIPTMAGAGASEAGFASVLLFFGVPLEQGVALAFLTRVVMILMDLLGLPRMLGYLERHTLDESLEALGKVKGH